MKKIFTICAAFCITASIFAQAPEKMSYQAVIRDGSNALVASSSVGMQISILQGSATGTAVYVERQFPVTNANGLVSLEIGTGTVVIGTFAGINWANGPYFIKTETDLTGGANYTITGTSQLLSVPYALHAKNTDSWIVDGDTTYTMKNVGIGSLPTNGINGTPLLDVSKYSPSTNTLSLRTGRDVNYFDFIFGTSSSSMVCYGTKPMYLGTQDSTSFYLKSNGINQAMLDPSGLFKIGFGNSTMTRPINNRRLEVVTGNYFLDSIGVGIYATGGYLNKSTYLEFGEASNSTLGARFFLNGNSNYFSIQTTNAGLTDALTIPYFGNNKDNVGIGTTAPARKLHINGAMRLEPRSTAPTSPSEGDIYMDAITHKLMVYDGTTWQACW